MFIMVATTLVSLLLSISCVTSQTSSFENMPNAHLTTFEGEILCNSQISGEILNTIHNNNFIFHAWKLNTIHNNNCKVSVNLLSNDTSFTSSVNVFDYKGNSNGIAFDFDDNNLPYYIQLKPTSKTYKFYLKCIDKCDNNDDDTDNTIVKLFSAAVIIILANSIAYYFFLLNKQ
eukprot:248092_1